MKKLISILEVNFQHVFFIFVIVICEQSNFIFTRLGLSFGNEPLGVVTELEGDMIQVVDGSWSEYRCPESRAGEMDVGTVVCWLHSAAGEDWFGGSFLLSGEDEAIKKKMLAVQP